LAKKQRKSSDTKKQRDREQMIRFPCNGHIKIIIDNNEQIAKLEMKHDLLHTRPEKYNVSEEVKNSIRHQVHLAPKDIFSTLELSHPELTQKQVHYWWTQAIQEKYKKDNDQLISAQIHLKESQLNKVLLLNVNSNVQNLAFTTIFFDQMKNNDEIIVDATCKNLIFEIYFFYLL
jgi:undecaprenyl pyrophosphate synthase